MKNKTSPHEHFLHLFSQLGTRRAKYSHKAANGSRDLTGKHPLGVVRSEGVVHEGSGGGSVVAAELVLGDQRVEAVVEVRGLVEREAAVLD